MAYWIALALHLGTPQADGYAKLSLLKAPDWMAQAPLVYGKLSSLKVPEWLAFSEHRAQGANPSPGPAPYEKLGDLKSY
jgi:hypothetical protein